MNAEATVRVSERAAVHSALGDVARLRIVDILSVGDAAPSELAELLGMPSNLLAHHLRVLEGVGLIARSRSEGDRRRSYLRLVPGALDALNTGGVRVARRVVFVCTANSARSQLAAALWRRASAVPATSAGTHPARRIDAGAVAAARRHALPLRVLRPRALADLVADDDFVITVCDNAHEELDRLRGLHWSVPDPVRVGTDAAFDAAFDELARRVSDLAPRLSATS
ncbi:helix-turn-helix domain-containing protein [Jatrophihabitans cynanchi]|uniref:Helix-turn-helix domain-containing protein n=1 Tax=Jatrophihabitans cynanchi TaxID=2944128 RepID=A0ABY7K463_9ACTN|nr:ArsR family transcriptional regulator [Jatrophihabitans sp. SB3-54]WAX58417.1 helix-turn-helix domain-containing protein [Jatrophihabitans sp. SB3-54]